MTTFSQRHEAPETVVISGACDVAWARNTECYTVATTYWIDL
jgi:hypothetical protein